MSACLVQLLLPVADNNGTAFPASVFDDVKTTLVAKFGGVTAYARSPAHGVWAAASSEERHDDIVIVEVMAPDIDETWWKNFRTHLEAELRQDEIVIRAFPITRL